MTGAGPRRVLFCEMGHHGGSVNRLLLLLRALDRSRVSPLLLSFFSDSTAGRLFELPLDFPREHLALKADPAPESLRLRGSIPVPTAFGFRYFRRAARMLGLHRPDLAYLNNTPFSHLPAVAACRLKGVPYVVHMRDTIRLTRAERWALGGSSAIVVLSHAAREFYAAQGVPADRMAVIYDGISLSDFDAARNQAPPPSPGRIVLALAGTLVPRKRAALAIDVVGRLAGEFPHLLLVILGDGPDREVLEARVRGAGLQGTVRIEGWTANVPARLAHAHVGLMVSDREGMPNVILEYMAAGLPVVATDLPGIREMVEDGATGFVVPRDEPGRLEEALRRLLSDAALRGRMGALGRKALEKGRLSLSEEHAKILGVIEGV
ncbi:MAG TPA: glycosyltransferase family 4 protein [Vicinamibacteria bacterium]|nr:glycosyltransferase family 4 protein [Vicinamibacteria bacterium]